jgi:hypothetical protein
MGSYGLKHFPNHTKPVEWNEMWERMIKKNRSFDVLQQYTSKGVDAKDMEGLLLNSSIRRRDLCATQHKLTIRAERAFTNDFESKWLRLSKRTRQKHLLEGMVRTCENGAPMMEDDRAFCDEVTLPYLQKAGGQGFLTLLRHFMLKDASSVSSTPIFLPNPLWDHMIGRNRKNLPDEHKAVQAYCDTGRNEFICMDIPWLELSDVNLTSSSTGHFLVQTLAAFDGSPAPTIVVKAQSHNRLSPSYVNNVGRLVGKAAAKSMKKDIIISAKAAVSRCEMCRKTEVQLGEDFKFMCCKACKDALDRQVYYCSK